MKEDIVLLVLISILLMKVIFGIPNYERLSDDLHLYWISSTIRYIESWFLSNDEYMRQVNWIQEMNQLTAQNFMLQQRDIFLKELVIEYAAKDKLNEISKLANDGPDDWQKKLQDQEMRMWIHQNRIYDHFTRKPNGCVVRGSMEGLRRLNKKVAKDQVGWLSRPFLVDACKSRGGCCARKCQCCLKPRGLSRENRLIHTHCTIFCGCCIRYRGFIYRDSEYGAATPGFVDHAKEPASIENASGKYCVK